MKKYNSPVCEIELLATSDIITTSSSEYRGFSAFGVGDLDNGRDIDVVEW